MGQQIADHAPFCAPEKAPVAGPIRNIRTHECPLNEKLLSLLSNEFSVLQIFSGKRIVNFMVVQEQFRILDAHHMYNQVEAGVGMP